MNLAYAGGGYDVPNMPYVQQVLNKTTWYEAILNFFGQYGFLGFLVGCLCLTIVACFFIWLKTRGGK